MNQLGNLDSESASSTIQLLSEIAKDKLVIIVTHNYEQVEKFVTRKIKMHDGRIIEDKVLKNIDNTEKIKEENLNLKNITFLNQLRLGIRNTFNILSKFILLFAVFLFITVAITSEYSTFKKQEYLLETSGNNYIYEDKSLNRIVIKKKDNSSFDDEDYNELENIENVDYLVKNDLLLDVNMELTDSNNIYLYGNAIDITKFSGEVDVGRLPENENEVIIEGNENDYYISFMLDSILNTDLYLSYNNTIDTETKLKVVGIKYSENTSNYYYTKNKIYVNNAIFDKLKFKINQQYSTIQVLFLNKYYQSNLYQNKITPNKNVPQGCAFVSYDLINYNNGYSIINKPLQIEVENIYYNDVLNLKISKTYTKYNLKSLVGLTNYDEINNCGSIFINEDDYNTLFNKDLYQSSIFVKDEERIYETKEQLEEMGYETIVIKDTLVNSKITEIIQIIRTIVTSALIITLFFISYFIIKMIFKSRNIYFSTIRMLGANQKTARNLLIIELLIVSNLAYWLCIGIVYLQYKGITRLTFLEEYIKYLKFTDYGLLYIILIGIAYLLSMKYSKKLFKKSTIKTYNEEV